MVGEYISLSIQLDSELGGAAMNSGGLSSDIGVHDLNLENLNCDPLLCAKVDGEYLKMLFGVSECNHGIV